MSKMVGIDLGTTNSLVAMVDSGIPLVIADPDGRRLTPSVVHFPESHGAPLVGEKANHIRAVQPRRTVYSVKRFMGRRGNEVSPAERQVTYSVMGQGSEPLTIDLEGRKVSPEEISAEILRKLKADAEFALGEVISRAVITVPAYFNDAQRTATKKAGELAGLVVERIINEPTAAALAYGLNRLRERSQIAVYDLGGGTFDLSILELHDGLLQVLSTNGNTLLGGDDLDQRIVRWLSDQIKSAGGPDPAADLSLTAKVRHAAETAKIRLSTETEVEINLPFLTTQFSFSARLTRATLEELTRDLIEQTRPHCLRALADAKIEARELDQVILVGGQTRMPLVREIVQNVFGCQEFEATVGTIRIGSEFHRPPGPVLNTSQNPDEAVALGAAIQAEILSGGYKDVLLLDVTPLSLGLETFGGLMNVIIPRNSTIPVKAGEAFTTAVDYQGSMLIHVLQGERERARDNWSLGQFTLEFEKARKGLARVGVQFEIDANGILQVLARDLKTNHERVVQMNSTVDVNDADVQRMVDQSVEYAVADLHLRQWVETKLRALEVSSLARNGLVQYRTELPEPDQARIDRALAEINGALATEDATTQAGDLARLKSALAELDAATQSLAEVMMDRAVEAALEKRGTLG